MRLTVCHRKIVGSEVDKKYTSKTFNTFLHVIKMIKSIKGLPAAKKAINSGPKVVVKFFAP